MNINKRYLLKIIGFFLVTFLISCKSNFASISNFSAEIPLAPDYQKEKYWAVLPTKYTKELTSFLKDSLHRLEADVFYVYPTLFTNYRDPRWNVSTTDHEQNAKVLNTAVNFQASAWVTSGKLYVPFYRQAHLRSYSNLENGGKEALLLAYEDVKAAFELYLNKYNQGRPIIIAGHSQGTTHCRLLLKDFFDNKPLQTQLIAAYIPGIGIEKDEYKTIPVMTNPTETGGFVSWNTYKRNRFPKKFDQWYKNKVTSNPITWDSTSTSERNAHQGFLYRNGKIYDNALKVQIINGLVWTTLPRFPHRLFAIFKKSYHVGDINLFWVDIKKNAELRVKSYLEEYKD